MVIWSALDLIEIIEPIWTISKHYPKMCLTCSFSKRDYITFWNYTKGGRGDQQTKLNENIWKAGKEKRKNIIFFKKHLLTKYRNIFHDDI